MPLDPVVQHQLQQFVRQLVAQDPLLQQVRQAMAQILRQQAATDEAIKLLISDLQQVANEVQALHQLMMEADEGQEGEESDVET